MQAHAKCIKNVSLCSLTVTPTFQHLNLEIGYIFPFLSGNCSETSIYLPDTLAIQFFLCSPNVNPEQISSLDMGFSLNFSTNYKMKKVNE